MGDDRLKLLEDRVLQAVAQVRALREERDRSESELRELQRRLEALEGEGAGTRRGLPAETTEELRRALEAVVRDLRDEAPLDAPEPADRASERGA